VYTPPMQHPARVAVVFLHGSGGNFAMPCWVFARAVEPVGAATLCPSVGPDGIWSTGRGEATVRASIAYLHARGVERIYLAGLSNGGIGASLLAPRLARELAGLVLIAGVSSRGGTGGLPTLVVHGRADTMARPGPARALVARAGSRATYAEFPGGHFVLIEHPDAVRDTITRWIAGREAEPRAAFVPSARARP
jgi:pimeloyl-ACP methyl ester carboxylesterase